MLYPSCSWIPTDAIMASVVNEIQALGVEVEHIPGGYTYLCQPVDIDINKPYKKHL